MNKLKIHYWVEQCDGILIKPISVFHYLARCENKFHFFIDQQTKLPGKNKPAETPIYAEDYNANN